MISSPFAPFSLILFVRSLEFTSRHRDLVGVGCSRLPWPHNASRDTNPPSISSKNPEISSKTFQILHQRRFQTKNSSFGPCRNQSPKAVSESAFQRSQTWRQEPRGNRQRMRRISPGMPGMQRAHVMPRLLPSPAPQHLSASSNPDAQPASTSSEQRRKSQPAPPSLPDHPKPTGTPHD